MTAAMEEIIPVQASPSVMPDSRQQPVWHVLSLSILTCMAYPFYWYYKTWRDLSQAAGVENCQNNPALKPFHNISPLLRTIGLVVPILNFYLALTLIKGIAELHPDSGSFAHRRPMLTAGIFTALLLICSSLSALPGAWYLCSFTAAIPLAVVQNWMNIYWRSVEPNGLNVRHAFSGKELLCIILGSLLLGLILASFWLFHGTTGGAH